MKPRRHLALVVVPLLVIVLAACGGVQTAACSLFGYARRDPGRSERAARARPRARGAVGNAGERGGARGDRQPGCNPRRGTGCARCRSRRRRPGDREGIPGRARRDRDRSGEPADGRGVGRSGRGDGGDGRRPARRQRDRHVHDRAWGLAIRVRRGGRTIDDRGVERIGAGLGECQCLGLGATIRHAHADRRAQTAVPDSGANADSDAEPHADSNAESDAITHAESDAEPHAVADSDADAEPDAIADPDANPEPHADRRRQLRARRQPRARRRRLHRPRPRARRRSPRHRRAANPAIRGRGRCRGSLGLVLVAVAGGAIYVWYQNREEPADAVDVTDEGLPPEDQPPGSPPPPPPPTQG